MRSWKLGFGALFLSFGGALFLTQCGDSNLGTPLDGGGGDSASGCPANPPSPGTACGLPNGTLCNAYAQPGCACCAGGGGYECSNGTWQEIGVSNGVAPQPMCPATLPEAGTSCTGNSSPCGAQESCSYDCVTGNGQVADAVCNGAT